MSYVIIYIYLLFCVLPFILVNILLHYAHDHFELYTVKKSTIKHNNYSFYGPSNNVSNTEQFFFSTLMSMNHWFPVDDYGILYRCEQAYGFSAGIWLSPDDSTSRKIHVHSCGIRSSVRND